jgi:FKBP-type peptidyl-prolyl cis-trans isomerase
MNRLLPLFCALVALGLAACGPKPPETPPAPQKSVAEERRERWFGVELAQKPGIEWRESGLGIEVLTPGEGTPPSRTDKVRVHYTGRLLDGTEFDSSFKTGKPADFLVQHLVTGLASAMTALQPGAKARVYVPPHLGYGGIKAGKIPPNSSLVFEVELIAVNPTDETKR